MPVQMRHQVAERGQIDLVGRHHLAQRGFGRQHHSHQGRLVVRRQVGHFLDVGIQDDAQKAGVIRFIGAHHATEVVLPQQGAAGCGTQRTAQSSTRSIPPLPTRAR
jgi:hypothetical protein